LKTKLILNTISNLILNKRSTLIRESRPHKAQLKETITILLLILIVVKQMKGSKRNLIWRLFRWNQKSKQLKISSKKMNFLEKYLIEEWKEWSKKI